VIAGAPLADVIVEAAMSTGSILIACVMVSSAARSAQACDPAVATAGLGRGVCALEAVPDGVLARSCVDGAPWMIAAPPLAGAVVQGAGGGSLGSATVDVLVSDGATSWLGISERQGCALRPRGLVRYDAKRDAAHAFRGTDAGPCGFLVQDLLLRDDTLWVATDLGVSRLRLSPEDWDEWTHYSLSGDGSALEETACASLLAMVAEAAAAPGGEELGRWLAEFRPRFVKRRRGTRPASPVG
jgi:hypothetical protein